MARAAASYRGARRDGARKQGTLVGWRNAKVVQAGPGRYRPVKRKWGK